MTRFEWVQAKSAQEAAKLASGTAAQLIAEGRNSTSAGTAVIKAGGIDLLDLIKEGILQPSRLVNIRLLNGLHAISYEAGKGMTIGPLNTLTEIEKSKEIALRYGALRDAAALVASPNIRNAATIGGNLLQRPHCWYFRSADFHCLRKGGGRCFATEGKNKYHAIFDNLPCAMVHPSTMAVPLIALGATVDLMTAEGKIRNVSLENFFLGPLKDIRRENLLAAHDLLTAIHLPDRKTSSIHLKICEKDSFDWPLVHCAVALEMNGSVCKNAAVVLGAVAPTPWRLKDVETMLAGKAVTEAIAAQAAELATRNARPLSQNAYKVDMVKTIIKKAVTAASRQPG